MPRQSLAPGEIGTISHQVKLEGKWVSEEEAKAQGVKPSSLPRRARARAKLSNGRDVRFMVSGPTKGAIEHRIKLKMREAEEKLAREIEEQKSRKTLGEYAQRYLDGIDSGVLERERSSATRTKYRYTAKTYALNSPLADLKIDDITRNQLTDELLRLGREGLTGERKHVLTIWRKLWEIADGDVTGTPPPSPLDRLRLPRDGAVSKNPQVVHKGRAYTDEEIATLMDTVMNDPRAQGNNSSDAIMLLLQTGCRIGEIAGLRWQDVDLKTDPPAVHLRGQIHTEDGERRWEPRLKSKLSYRSIPLTQQACEVLKRRLSLRMRPGATDAEMEFVSATARTGNIPDPRALTRSIKRTLSDAGHPEMSSHTFRRIVERRLEESGLSRMDRESLMGHTIQVAERHYSTHGVPQRALEALQAEPKRTINGKSPLCP